MHGPTCIFWANLTPFSLKPGGMPFVFLDRVPYKTSAAWQKYPGLADILQDEPCLPKHNGARLPGTARAFLLIRD
jgi:hypothetical protein